MHRNLDSAGVLRRWTDSAKSCYKRGCVCEGCEVNNLNLSVKCVMNEVVKRLILKHGLPDDLISTKGVIIEDEELIG